MRRIWKQHRFWTGSAILAVVCLSLYLTPLTHLFSSGPARVTLSPDSYGPGYELEWEGREGNVYFIERSRDLIKWELIPVFELGDGRPIRRTFHNEEGEATAFYRLVYSDDPNSELLSADYSGAGITSWDQIQLGYHPFKWVDTVGNRIHDAWEMHHFGMVGIDPNGDADGDGMANLLEFLLATDPNDASDFSTAVTTPESVHTHATTETVYLGWEKSLGMYPISFYRIYRDGAHLRNFNPGEWKAGITDVTAEAGRTYVYGVQGRDNKGTFSEIAEIEVTTPLESAIPSPWNSIDLGEVYQGPGHSAYHESSDLYVLAASAGDIIDNHHFVYREFVGDFAVSTRVHLAEPTSYWSKAGLAVTEDLSGEGRGVSYAFSGMSDAQIQKRGAYGGGIGAITTPGVHTEGWIRIERSGEVWRFSASRDGLHWIIVGEEFLELPADAPVYLGLAVANNNQHNYGTGVFSDLVFEDRTGPEWNPADSTDSDGDGFTDYEETYILFSDPGVADIGEVVVEQTLKGSDRSSALGRWAVVGDQLHARDERGWIEYTVQLPEDGIYRLSLELTELANPNSDRFHEFDFYLGDHFVDRVRLRLDADESGFAQIITPYLAAGEHTLRVYWDNTLTYRRIAVHGLEVHSLEDLGWVGHRLNIINGVITPVGVTNTTHISPFLIEGWAKHVAYLEVLDPDGHALETKRLPGDHWMAELPLAADGDAAEVAVRMENSALIKQVSARWVPLNVLEAEAHAPLRLRVEDQLMLDLGGADGELVVSRPDDADFEPVIFDLSGEGEIAVHAFATAGQYQISATTSDGAAAQLDVIVYASRFAGDLIIPTAKPAPWSHPDLDFSAEVEFDSRLAMAETTPVNGARTFIAGTNETLPRYLAARVPQSGAVLDTASVTGVRIASSLQTSLTFADALPDGTEIIEMPVVVSEVIPGMEVTLRIAVQGVTFDDGSLVKVLTADDFDELGRAMVRFLRSGDTATANCYVLDVTFPTADQGGEQ